MSMAGLTRQELETARANAFEAHGFAEEAFQDGSGDCDELTLMLAREASKVLELLAHIEAQEKLLAESVAREAALAEALDALDHEWEEER